MAEFDQTSAAHAVLIEVAQVLGAFRNDVVIVGGWVPELLYPDKQHIGSLDVDLAVAPTALAGNAYQSICQRLLKAGYSHHTPPTHFTKQIIGASDPVKVDLISGQYIQGGKSASIVVNELQISSVRGIDLAFEAWDEIEIAGVMPDGARNVVRVRIVRPEVFILIKAFALGERQKEKDAYDIAFVLRHYVPDLTMLAGRMQPHIASGLGQEAYQILKAKFATHDSIGPVWAASMFPGTDTEFEQRAAFEDAQELFRLVGQE